MTHKAAGKVAGPTNGKHDVLTHRMVVGFLGTSAVVSCGGMIALSFTGMEVPPSLSAFGSVALGALAGMLATIMR